MVAVYTERGWTIVGYAGIFGADSPLPHWLTAPTLRSWLLPLSADCSQRPCDQEFPG